MIPTTLNTILLFVALVLALPGGIFIAWLLSLPRARFLALLGGLVGGVAVAVFIYAFLAIAQPNIDAISFFVGAFFACSAGVAIGALVGDFLVGLMRRGPDLSSLEF